MGIIPAASSFEVIHREAVAEANGWRGRCINLFARGERIVGEALAVAELGAKPPQHLKTKLDRLSKVRADSATALKAIDRFDSFLELRNVIVHNEARLFADLKGSWIIQFEPQGSVPTRLSTNEAEALRREIQQAVDKLENALSS